MGCALFCLTLSIFARKHNRRSTGCWVSSRRYKSLWCMMDLTHLRSVIPHQRALYIPTIILEVSRCAGCWLLRDGTRSNKRLASMAKAIARAIEPLQRLSYRRATGGTLLCSGSIPSGFHQYPPDGKKRKKKRNVFK